MNYNEFLHTKIEVAPVSGFEIPKTEMNPMMFEWQKDIVYWALKKGRAALFEECGNGKTIQQLEFSQAVFEHTGKPTLIVAPLTVAEQTEREARKFGYTATLCRTQEDVKQGINITNYEMLDHFDASHFGGVVLDESSILKNFAGKVRNQIIDMFRDVPYRLSCSATPSPNDHMELGNQAEFLGVMSRTEMLATFFTHDGSNTSQWRLKGHAESRFWEWVASWEEYATPTWWDINQSDTLNRKAAKEEKDERHICPLQLPVIERCVELWSNPGDVVMDPFDGIGSTGYQAILMGRKHIGVELKSSYYALAVENCRAAEQQLDMQSKSQVSMFDLIEQESI